MFIAYYDEAGDDGYPKYSSPLFVLTAVYFSYKEWQAIYKKILLFRRQLNSEYGFPVTLEMHTKHFLLNKKPYRALHINNEERISIIKSYCEFIATLPISIINTAINKKKIINQDYKVLHNALTYSVQRMENHVSRMQEINEEEKKVMIISDEGRIGVMRRTTRQIQRINYIPSQFGTISTNQPIKCLIEDPLQKKSRESYFIQIADLIATIIYYHLVPYLGIGTLSNRISDWITSGEIDSWINLLKPVLNLNASNKNEYGIVIYPR